MIHASETLIWTVYLKSGQTDNRKIYRCYLMCYPSWQFTCSEIRNKKGHGTLHCSWITFKERKVLMFWWQSVLGHLSRSCPWCDEYFQILSFQILFWFDFHNQVNAWRKKQQLKITWELCELSWNSRIHKQEKRQRA